MTNMNLDQSAWRPYITFVDHLREKYAKNEVLHEEEEKPVKRRGRPRKVRDVPDVANVRGKKLFKDDGHNSSGEESISASDHQGHGEDNDSDDDTDQPLINTIRSSAAKLRSLKISQKGTSSQKGAPGSSATFQDFFPFYIGGP